MSQLTEQSVRFQTALASIKLIQASAVLNLTEDDFAFLTSNIVWIATDRSRARRCVEACVYGTLDFVGYPRFPAPVEFIVFFFSSRIRHTSSKRDWSSDVCSSDLRLHVVGEDVPHVLRVEVGQRAGIHVFPAELVALDVGVLDARAAQLLELVVHPDAGESDA